MIQPILDEIADMLLGGSLNYGVFLQFYEVKLDCTGTSSNLVEKALGSGAIVGGIREVESFAVWPEIEQGVFYGGGPTTGGAGPAESIIASSQLACLASSLRKQVDELAGTASKIESFWLRDGHPAYPVFWDFAFLFQEEASAAILIGSASD